MQRLVLLRIGALTAVAIAGVIGLARADSPALTHITVITSPSDSGGEVYYAQDLGIFKKYGLEVSTISVGGGAAVTAAMASGKYDIGQGNVATVAAAREAGLPFVLVAPGSLYDSHAPTSAIVVAKDSPIQRVADLVGKNVANPATRDIGTVGLNMLLMQQGIDPATVHVIEMPQAVSADAVSRGTVDAAILIEPFLSSALTKTFRVVSDHYTSIGSHFMIGAYFAESDWVTNHPDVARAFAAAMQETARWANAHHAESAGILAKYTNVAISPNQMRTPYAESLEPALIQPLIDAAVKTKLMKAPLSASTLLMQ